MAPLRQFGRSLGRRRVWFLGLALLAAGAVVASARAADAPPKLRVLVLSGLNNHDWRSTTPVVQQALAACDRFGPVDVTDNPAAIDAATLARYDVLVSNWTPYPDTRRSWSPATEAAFFDFIRRGGGLVVIHAAACTFQVWPEFQDLIALTWKADYTAHGAYHTFAVAPAEPEHPIARGLGTLYTTDELYHNMVHMTNHPYRVAFKAFSAKDKGGTGKDEPVVVCTEIGRGRGVNLVLGHDAPSMGAAFKTLLRRCAEFAATGQVTIPAPAILASSPAAMAAADIELDATLAAVARYQYGDPRKPLADLHQLIVYAESRRDVALRSTLADRMAGLVAAPGTTAAAKAILCRELATIGEQRHTAPLAALLADKELAVPALAALSQIRGPAVDDILQQSLPSLQGDVKIAAINALGERRVASATTAIVGLLASADQRTACAAACALGKIGSDDAAAALGRFLDPDRGRVREAAADALLDCAGRMLADKRNVAAAGIYGNLSGKSQGDPIRMAAFRGLVLAEPEKAVQRLCAALGTGDPARVSMAIRLIPAVRQPGATLAFAECLRKTPPEVQVALLEALAARRDKAAARAIEAAAAGNDATVRLAALEALGSCGDAAAAAMLAARAASGKTTPEGAAARASLLALRAPGVNESLVALLPRWKAAERAELIRILAARNALAAVDALQKATDDADAAVRREAWKALGALARRADLPALLDRLTRATVTECEDAESAVAAVLRRSDRAALPIVLDKLTRCDNTAAGAAARASLLRVAGSTGDDRALAALRKAVAAPDAIQRDAAIRALAAWPNAAPLDELIAIARGAKEPAHRTLALQAAMTLAAKAKDQPPEKMRRLFVELLSLAGETADPEVVARAAKVLKDVLKPTNLALGATATSPDGIESDGSSGGDKAAIDGNPDTYWDEVDNAAEYRLRVTFAKPTDVSAINILWHPYPQHVARNFDVLCDGKLAKEVRNGPLVDNEMFVRLPPVRCTSVELVIPGRNGLVSPAIHEFEIYNNFPPKDLGTLPGTPQSGPKPLGPAKLSWQQTQQSLALLNHDRVVWQFNHGPGAAKPFFHPVSLVDGTVLTAPSPADHPWHRALWFSWKMLNGVNYWEEDPKGQSQGHSELVSAKLSPRPDGAARIELVLNYHPAGQPTVLGERRLIEISAPDAAGAYHFDWLGTFTAGAKDLFLEGGTAGGGYAGMSARIAQSTGDWMLIDSEGRRDLPTDGDPKNTMGVAATTHGKRARWMEFSMVDRASGQPCGLAILDHPANPRHPSQWHNVLAARGRFGYFSPAMLWSEPYKLAAGQSFTLRYRILVHPDRWPAEKLQQQWQAFAAK